MSYLPLSAVPVETGIQGDSAPAVSYVFWIPAPGRTWDRLRGNDIETMRLSVMPVKTGSQEDSAPA